MIDIKQIRENPQKYKDGSKAKKFQIDIDRLLEVDKCLLACKKRLQDIATDKNRIGKDIPKLPPEQKNEVLAALSRLKEEEAELNEEIKNLQPEFDALMMQVPQPPAPEVPYGEDDTQNVELRRWGTVRQFDFQPKDHVELGLALDIIDIERGVKLAGTRNYFLKGDGALLHWAVLRFAMDHMIAKGYTPMVVPLLMRDEVMMGTGYFPGSEEQTYQMERDALNLAGTAEVPVTAYHSGEILSQDKLPIKSVALSTCFRREAGAAGKDTRGLYRIHQFDKVEQVIIGENDEAKSIQYHYEILNNSEEVLQALHLPYRVVNVCTGDLGRGQVQKFDIETWMPSRNGYGETHSASRFYEFQARRMNLRYKTATGRNEFCHTLNNTVIASPRILIPILELYQNADGSVTIPEVLRPYMFGKERIEPK
ncbi:MAG TPA: serine--tRNA ligase [Anaerohalosphaeraceae bacterium]|nr:serine--tRNA ligase [Anaerohalosphaeraceae bacterium]HOM75958.1 serine--tRNA ligase [Anaerohalosphaeraceae bacterium]HPC63508.1 serine--tRNA ligase [Anaerohalosphaeraceae bacterium]HRS72223.1 serine--tRNA ligase [Anaerohalosphaeraceae bacterium]HRV19708.1 serine--tRNA ligase [Anaerohalosphaeraceae bacterium]